PCLVANSVCLPRVTSASAPAAARARGAALWLRSASRELRLAGISSPLASPPRHYLGQTPITIRQAGCFFLTLGEKSLERLVQADGLIDLRAGAGPIGAEPDEFLHIRIRRHHLPGTREDRHIGRIGGAPRCARSRF